MERKLKDLQKSGALLCAVPISNIIGRLESEARISVTTAPALASVASGKAIAAAVTAIVVGTTGVMFYFGKDKGQLQGDERVPDSSVVEIIDDQNTVTTSRATTTTRPVTTPETYESTSPATTTTTSASTTSSTTAAPAVPAATVPVQTTRPNNVQNANNNVQTENTESTENGSSEESNTDDSSKIENESSQFAIDYWYADPYDIDPSGISVSGINKKIYDIETVYI